MVDLHTHILPGMDDGAADADVSLQMLRMERAQGVNAVVLTPHFYRHRESPERFLHRRAQAVERLMERLGQLEKEELSEIPDRLVVGCEAAWSPDLAVLDCLPELCIGKTKNLLLELPFTPWDDSLSRGIYDLMSRTGITPVLAHLERYLKIQSKEKINEILSLGVPIQIGTDTLNGFWSRRQGIKALENWAHVIASDCHNVTDRSPSMGEAMQFVEKKMGKNAAARFNRNAWHLITPADDRA